jgi:hypothetical protein
MAQRREGEGHGTLVEVSYSLETFSEELGPCLQNPHLPQGSKYDFQN